MLSTITRIAPTAGLSAKLPKSERAARAVERSSRGLVSEAFTIVTNGPHESDAWLCQADHFILCAYSADCLRCRYVTV